MIDGYTKCILSIIAAALVCIALQNAMPSATAQSFVQRVAICNEDGTRCAQTGSVTSPSGTGTAKVLLTVDVSGANIN